MPTQLARLTVPQLFRMLDSFSEDAEERRYQQWLAEVRAH